MAYQVTARKWRPMVFEDVVGQSHVTETLKNAIATNRVAHAFIFSGSRGCGKTTTARILAKAINCLAPKSSNPDNACEVCDDITSGRSLDVIEIDGASNRGIDEIRNLRDAVRFPPSRAKYKIYIIDEVHMLTPPAFNALLKTLEEPPPHVIFIFATTEVQKVPATILSRCQRFDFRRIPSEEIAQRLRFIAKEENVSIDEESLLILARKGEGSMRDAQSFFDQVRSFCGSTITSKDVLKTLNVVDQAVYFRISELIRTKDRKNGIAFVNEIFQGGVDLREFVIGLTEHFRHLLVARTTGATDLIEASDHFRSKYAEEAVHFSETDLLRLLKLTYDLQGEMKDSPQPRFRFEVGLLQMISMESSVQIEELLRDLELLKKKLTGSEGPKKTADPSWNNSTAGAGTRVSSAPAGEMKVVGPVSAGRMRQPAVVPISSAVAEADQAMPTHSMRFQDSGGASENPKRQEEASGGSSMKSISANEAYARWQEWVGEVSRKRISVGSILGETQLVDVHDGSVTIACPDDYHVSSLKRYREFLTDSFRSMTGYDIRIDPVLSTARGQRSGSAHPPQERIPGVAEEATPATADVLDNHPVVVALRRELGAERVD